jgi:hypothetical protein
MSVEEHWAKTHQQVELIHAARANGGVCSRCGRRPSPGQLGSRRTRAQQFSAISLMRDATRRLTNGAHQRARCQWSVGRGLALSSAVPVFTTQALVVGPVGVGYQSPRLTSCPAPSRVTNGPRSCLWDRPRASRRTGDRPAQRLRDSKIRRRISHSNGSRR